jgi:type II restriction enzyme
MKEKQYIDPVKCKTFSSKPKSKQRSINQALEILEAFGVPTEGTPRRLERMAIAFLAVSDVKSTAEFKKAKDLVSSKYSLKTREVIEYVNTYFGENISSGSYDNIRRKDLKILVAAGIVLQSSPDSATNDSTRGYGVNPIYAELMRQYPSKNWHSKVSEALKDVDSIAEKLKRKRDLSKIPVQLPKGEQLLFSKGLHNDLQKAIIETFLPRYGHGATVLYVVDTADKYLHLDKEGLNEINFFEIKHDELPDIIAYSKSKNWLYLIEAVHSSGSIDELRLMQLQKLTEHCTADIIYVTAFLDKPTFRKFIADIAWETEVWIADNPDHLIHFNGEKFLGPY